MDLKDSIIELITRGENTTKVFDVFDDGDAIHKLIVYGAGVKPEIRQFEKVAVPRNHTFKSLDGFVDYLNSSHCAEDKGVLFVGDRAVEANLAYGTYSQQRISLPLDFSEEFEALISIMRGVEQKGLWRALVSTLKGCIDASLLLAVSQVRVSGTTEKDCKVDITGVQNGTARDAFSVTFQERKDGATTTREIPVDWAWKGRIWECFDSEYEIKLRLEIEATENGLRFLFHPERLKRLMRESRLDLVRSIAAKVPDQFTVHEGQI